MAGNLRSRFGARPAYVKPSPKFRQGLGTEERDAGLPEFVEYLEYFDQAGALFRWKEDARAPAIDDRSRRQRPGVFTRVRARVNKKVSEPSAPTV